jgi:hypothetical protein
MTKIKYDTIPKDVIIDIQISGTFYRGLTDLLTMLGESVPLDDFKKILEKLKANNPAESMLEFNVFMIMSLVYEIEKKAKEQNKTKQEEIDVPEEPVATGN